MPLREASPRLAYSYAEALLELAADDQALSFIEAQLEREWDSRPIGSTGVRRAAT